jgi:hypothetical protein
MFVSVGGTSGEPRTTSLGPLQSEPKEQGWDEQNGNRDQHESVPSVRGIEAVISFRSRYAARIATIDDPKRHTAPDRNVRRPDVDRHRETSDEPRGEDTQRDDDEGDEEPLLRSYGQPESSRKTTRRMAPRWPATRARDGLEGVLQALRLRQRRERLERGVLDLPDPFAGEAQGSADLI